MYFEILIVLKVRNKILESFYRDLTVVCPLSLTKTLSLTTQKLALIPQLFMTSAKKPFVSANRDSNIMQE